MEALRQTRTSTPMRTVSAPEPTASAGRPPLASHVPDAGRRESGQTRHPALLRSVSTVDPQAPYRLTRTG